MWKQKISLTFLIFVVIVTLAACKSYQAASFKVDGDQAIMTGAIDAKTPKRVEALIRDYPNVHTIVLKDVEGSVDDEANLEAARLLRQHGFKTHVPADGVIASGGTDFFLAGIERSVEAGAKLGVHSWAAGNGKTGADFPRDDPQHQLYLSYYEEMGIPSDFYWFTLEAASAEGMHWMTVEEMQRYDIETTLTSEENVSPNDTSTPIIAEGAAKAFGDPNSMHIGRGLLRQPVREAPENIYTDSGIVSTSDYGAYTKKMTVYGITFIAKENMPDTFMLHVAQTMKDMFVQTDATDRALQEAVLKNLYRYHAVLPIVSSENPDGLEELLATSSIADIIMNNSSHQAMEVVEHILHAVTDIGLHSTLNDQFGLHEASDIFKAMQEASTKGFYAAADYNDIPAGETRNVVLVQEYIYWVITSAWNLQETYGLGEREWALKNAELLQAQQASAYALVENFINKIMSAPQQSTLQLFGS